MKEKLLLIGEEGQSSPYALIVKINEKLVLSKLDKYSSMDFTDVLLSSLVDFINEQCDIYGAKENDLDMTNAVYIWLVTENKDLYDFLFKKLESINQVDLISKIQDIKFLKQEIDKKINYYSLKIELDNNQVPTKRIKI